MIFLEFYSSIIRFPSFRVGDDVSIVCPFRGNPSPQYSWTYNSTSPSDSDVVDNIVDPLGVVRLSSDSRALSIVNASENDIGVYFCRATNELGSDSFSVSLLHADETNTIDGAVGEENTGFCLAAGCR